MGNIVVCKDLQKIFKQGELAVTALRDIDLEARQHC